MLDFNAPVQRVLYVDIDVHHGDGVEEAFYTTDRVMTVFPQIWGFLPRDWTHQGHWGGQRQVLCFECSVK